MARRRSSSARREQRESRNSIFKISIVVALGVAVGAVYLYVALSRQDLDKTTLCPITPTSSTVLLVDVTDPMNVTQRQDFLNQLERLKNSVPRFGKLTVLKVDATAEHLLKPIIERCNPGTGEEDSKLTGNPTRTKKQWEEDYNKKLDQAFEGLLIGSGADASPILESIQSAALTELQKQSAEKAPKRLIVASDLLQNTADTSFYQGLPDPSDFVQTPAFARTRTNLRGVEVELWMLQRLDSNETQPRALPDLWERIISEQGGTLTRVYTVSG